MLLDVPSPWLLQAFGFCMPGDWCRLRAAHNSLSFTDSHLLSEVLGEDLSAWPSLSDAARQGLTHVVLARLRNGEEPNVRDAKHPKYMPLHRATSGGHRQVVRLLLSMRANVNARDRLGFCSLHFAANQSSGLVQDLLAARCDVDGANLQGVTPLHSAAGMGRGDICDLLLAAGARTSVDSSGASPAEMARRAAERRSGSEREERLALVDCLEAAAASQSAKEDVPTWCFSEEDIESEGERHTWIAFDLNAVAVIEAARKQDPDVSQVEVAVRNATYIVNFKRLTQTNLQTGTVRRIRWGLPKKTAVVKGWVPAAAGHWEGLVSTGASTGELHAIRHIVSAAAHIGSAGYTS